MRQGPGVSEPEPRFSLVEVLEILATSADRIAAAAVGASAD
jgi:hypothetical protein